MLLLSMPWEQLEYPSIQLGILGPVLERAGIRAETRSLNLDFMEHCARDGLSVRSYRDVVNASRDVSLGDWIFSAADDDAGYLAHARRVGVREQTIAAALEFRNLVPSFLARVAGEIADSRPALVGFTIAFNQTIPSLALASALRERLGDDVRIVFGGANCQGPMGAALHRAYPVIDAVARGEGAHALPALPLDRLAGREPRPQAGLCFRDATGEQVVIDE